MKQQASRWCGYRLCFKIFLRYYADLCVRVIYPHAHVEGDDSDSDVLGGLPVDVWQLQPGVVLLLPRLQGVSGCERRSYRGQITQIFAWTLFYIWLVDQGYAFFYESGGCPYWLIKEKLNIKTQHNIHLHNQTPQLWVTVKIQTDLHDVIFTEMHYLLLYFTIYNI